MIFSKKYCYDCPYAKIPRESDITLGDFGELVYMNPLIILQNREYLWFD